MKKLLVCAAAVMAFSCVMAAENVIYSFAFNSKKEFNAWASKAAYPAYEISFADGVAKLTVKDAAAGGKGGFQVMPFFNQGFKKGVTYKVTGMLKSSEAVRIQLCIQLSGSPYTVYPMTNNSKWCVLKMQPGVAQDFALEFTAPEDISAICRTPGIHTGPMKTGTVLECSNFKVIEVQK